MCNLTIPNRYHCPACRGRKARHVSLCGDCLETYGESADEWPEWLRFLVNDEMRWLRECDAADENETPYDDDCDCGDEDYD